MTTSIVFVRREELPLVLASRELSSPDETQPLDRIRMQKAVFLAERRGPVEWRNVYQFEPYDWGPFSRDLSEDLRSMIQDGRLQLMEKQPGRYPAFATSDLGEAEAREFLEATEPNYVAFLRQVRLFVSTRSFGQLLRDV